MGTTKIGFVERRTVGGGKAEIVIRCGQVCVALEDVSRGQVANNLRSARITSLADGFLAELRASADIVYH